MPLTYPLTPPAYGVRAQHFGLNRADVAAPENRGLVGGVTLGWPLWEARYELAPMTSEQSDEWTAFLDGLDGSQNLFYGRDLNRSTLRRGLYGATVASWSVDSTRQVLTLDTNVGGLVVKPRDYIGFEWTTGGAARRALVRAVETVVGDADGVVAVTVRPGVPALVPGTATVNLNKPTCLMKMTDADLAPMGPERFVTGSVSTLQVLLP